MLPRLQTRFDLKDWYRRLAADGRPVAWCSAFAPAEILLACGLSPVYPENHAAMLGALSPDRDPQKPFARAAIERAEAAGHGMPQLCSYAQADLGVLLGADSPIQGLPPPDLFYACNSQCSVVERWGDRVQAAFADQGRAIPHLVLKVPPLTRGERHSPAELAGVQAQVHEHLRLIEAQFGRRLDPQRLQEVVAESAAANRLWQQCLELGRRRPAPWSNTDAWQAMAPIVVARGDPACTEFYRRLLAELQARLADGVQAVDGEELRLLWDAIPIWPRKNWLAEELASQAAVLAASTYTHSWWFSFDTTQPLASLIERYSWNTMNRSGQWVFDWTMQLIQDYACDGVICHWNHSCGIWNSFVKRRLPRLLAAGIPTLVIEADMVDARYFDEGLIRQQLRDFTDALRQGRRAPA